MIVICMYCGIVKQAGTGLPSHGICDRCLSVIMWWEDAQDAQAWLMENDPDYLAALQRYSEV